MKEDSFRAQLAEFREADEARWRFEAANRRRQNEIRQKLGRSDDVHKRELEQAGLNVQYLEEQSGKWAEEERRIHTEILELDPSSPPRDGKDRIKLDQITAMTHGTSWLYPPAIEGYGNAEACGVNPGLGEFNLIGSTSGDGRGWAADAKGDPLECVLWVYYFPPHPGELVVEPHYDIRGSYHVNAHDHWYTSTHAELDLDVIVDVYQHYWTGTHTWSIIGEHRHNSSAYEDVDMHVSASRTLDVSAHDIVWIKITASLDMYAHSSHASVVWIFVPVESAFALTVLGST